MEKLVLFSLYTFIFFVFYSSPFPIELLPPASATPSCFVILFPFRSFAAAPETPVFCFVSLESLFHHRSHLLFLPASGGKQKREIAAAFPSVPQGTLAETVSAKKNISHTWRWYFFFYTRMFFRLMVEYGFILWGLRVGGDIAGQQLHLINGGSVSSSSMVSGPTASENMKTQIERHDTHERDRRK